MGINNKAQRVKGGDCYLQLITFLTKNKKLVDLLPLIEI